MNNLLRSLDGKKTYLVAILAGIVTAGYVLGILTQEQALKAYSILIPAGAVTMRSAVGKARKAAWVVMVCLALSTASAQAQVTIVRPVLVSQPASLVLIERQGCLNRLFFGRYRVIAVPQVQAKVKGQR